MARPVGALGRAAKWARRRPAVAALIGVVALALGTLVAGAVLFTLSLDAARERAERGEADALEQKGLAEQREKDANAQRARAEKGEALAGERLRLARLTAYNLQLQRAGALVDKGPAEALALLNDKDICPEELRDFTHGLLARRCLGGEVRTLRQPGAVGALAASADGTVLAVGVVEGQGDKAKGWVVTVWDALSGRQARTVRLGEEDLFAIAVDPKGTKLAYAGGEADVRLVDLAGGVETALPHRHGKIKGEHSAKTMAFSPDGKTLAVGLNVEGKAQSGSEVWFWNVATGKRVEVLSGVSGRVEKLAYSPDGKAIAVATERDAITLWTLKGLKQHARVPNDLGIGWSAESLMYAPDGRSVVVSGAEGLIFFDATSGKLQRAVAHQSPYSGVRGARFSPGGRRFATFGQTRTELELVTIHDTASGKIQQALTSPSAFNVTEITYLKDDLLAVGTGRTVQLHRLTPNPVRLLATPSRHVEDELSRLPGVALAPGGRWVAAGEVAPFDPEAPAAQKRNSLSWLSGVGSIAFSPDGLSLAGAVSREVRLGTGPGWGQRRALTGHDERVSGLAWCPDGSLLSGGLDGTVRRWDVKTGRHAVVVDLTRMAPPLEPDLPEADRRRIRDGAGRLITRLAASPNGKLVAIAACLAGPAEGALPSVEVWDLEKRKRLQLFVLRAGGANALAFDPASRLLAVGCQDRLGPPRDSSLALYDVGSGKEAVALRELSGTNALAFSPDGKVLASGNSGGELKFWCVATGQLRASVPGHEGVIYDLAFSRDGRLVGAANTDQHYHYYLWQATR